MSEQSRATNALTRTHIYILTLWPFMAVLLCCASIYSDEQVRQASRRITTAPSTVIMLRRALNVRVGMFCVAAQGQIEHRSKGSAAMETGGRAACS